MPEILNYEKKYNRGKKAIVSLIIGVFFMLLEGVVFFLGLMSDPWAFTNLLIYSLIASPVLLFFLLIGLLFGIMGLKSTKKKMSIIGIILCGLDILMPLIFLVLLF